MTEEPFGAKPNLCVSADIDVTPVILKSAIFFRKKTHRFENLCVSSDIDVTPVSFKSVPGGIYAVYH